MTTEALKGQVDMLANIVSSLRAEVDMLRDLSDQSVVDLNCALADCVSQLFTTYKDIRDGDDDEIGVQCEDFEEGGEED